MVHEPGCIITITYIINISLLLFLILSFLVAKIYFLTMISHLIHLCQLSNGSTNANPVMNRLCQSFRAVSLVLGSQFSTCGPNPSMINVAS